MKEVKQNENYLDLLATIAWNTISGDDGIKYKNLETDTQKDARIAVSLILNNSKEVSSDLFLNLFLNKIDKMVFISVVKNIYENRSKLQVL